MSGLDFVVLGSSWFREKLVITGVPRNSVNGAGKTVQTKEPPVATDAVISHLESRISLLSTNRNSVILS